MLEEFFSKLKQGLSIDSFLREINTAQEKIDELRKSNSLQHNNQSLKKYHDEVVPVKRYICKMDIDSRSTIKFNLNNQYPDCILLGSQKPISIEVTQVRARENNYLLRQMRDQKHAPGFLGVSEEAPEIEFCKAKRRKNHSYSTQNVIETIEEDLKLRVNKKRHHEGDVLLIETNLTPLPHDTWTAYIQNFRNILISLKFKSIYITGPSEGGESCIKIK
ncbi:hypothetical protein [Breoghania sp.]|uniref:hypothetical protein n=1 Tax=Breoghania sp. TaxID=2065378 RepID=UPI0029CA6DCA|nr:hypothetical protein [Breoghania sp.]